MATVGKNNLMLKSSVSGFTVAKICIEQQKFLLITYRVISPSSFFYVRWNELYFSWNVYPTAQFSLKISWDQRSVTVSAI